MVIEIRKQQAVLLLVAVTTSLCFGCNREKHVEETEESSGVAERQTVDPELKATIHELIRGGHFRDATTRLKEIDVLEQVVFDVERGDGRFMAVAEELVFLPGISGPAEHYEYWLIPATSDAVVNYEWQVAATQFAHDYNRRMAEYSKSQNDQKEKRDSSNR